MLRSTEAGPGIEGTCAPGFEEVRRAFEENVLRRREVGASLCVWHDGRVVVDLWAGVSDPESGRRWAADTPAIVFSTTKGLVASCFAQLAERGALDLDAPIAELWPGFARNGKGRITTRQLLNHRSGLSAVDAPLSLADCADRDKIVAALEAQRPLWEPGTHQGYGATSWGLYAGEVFRRAAGRTVGSWLRDEITGPLHAEIWLGDPPPDVVERAARLVAGGPRTVATRIVPSALLRRTCDGRVFRRVLFAPSSPVRRALQNPDMGPERQAAMNERQLWSIEMPWMGALATARGLCRVYAAHLEGRVVGSEAAAELHRRQSWSRRDQVLQKPVGFSQGFLKEEPHLFSPSPASFGHAGAGGSLGWADPEAGVAIGYVMNRLDWRIRSPRAIALCRAVYRALARQRRR